MGERWVVGADDREGTGLDCHKPCPYPWPSFLWLSWVPWPAPFPSFRPGRFEGGGLRDMREGEREGLWQQELSGQKFNGEPGPQGSGTPAPGLGTFFLLNLVCLSPCLPTSPRNLWVWSHSTSAYPDEEAETRKGQ